MTVSSDILENSSLAEITIIASQGIANARPYDNLREAIQSRRKSVQSGLFRRLRFSR
jgi:hypothetical protein